ncbi:MAG: NAD(P)-dependent oxidoreductase [Candidatus Omnitrophica bacterium]|nr:NAD(P)-dependent oxidoreductase [Candidatus Omnitrophota bacterium]
MRILVTGNTGYIGTVMAKFLQDRDHEVVGVDSDYYKGCEFYPAQERPFRQIFKDVDNIEACDLDGVEAVIHLAALSNDPLGELNPGLTHKINCVSSVNLAKLAKSIGISRYLFSSSCSVYGIAPGDKALTEEDEVDPLTAYAKAKVDSEIELAKLADSNFHPTFLRNATAYGLSPKLRLDLVVNNLLAWAHITGKVTILSDGSPWRPIAHAEDLCRAFLAIVQAPVDKVHNQTFNVGRNSENYRVRDIAHCVEKVVVGSRVEIKNTAGSDERSYRVDFSKIKNTLDFNPVWDLEMGVNELYDAYRKFNLTQEGFDSNKYFRIRTIRKLIDDNRVDEEIKWRM